MSGSIIDMKRLEIYRENNRIEAKKALGGLPHSLWETYSAFANTLGGILLLGVEERKDGSFLVHDLPDPQRLIDEFWSIVSDPEHVSRNILKPEQVPLEIEMPAPIAHRQVLFQGQDGYINTPVYWREDFVPGQTILGPCICEQMDTTLVVPKGWTLCVDGYHNLKIRADEVE